MPKRAPAQPAEDLNDGELGFLGRELLTWLLWRADRGEATFGEKDAGPTVAFGGKARLKGLAGDGTDTVLKGGQAAHAVAVRAALGCGRTLREAELILFAGEREWRFILDADTLDLRSVRLPEAAREEGTGQGGRGRGKPKRNAKAGPAAMADAPDADRLDERLLDRLGLLQELDEHIQLIFKEFLRERARPTWTRTTVPALRDWLAEGLRVDPA